MPGFQLQLRTPSGVTARCVLSMLFVTSETSSYGTMHTRGYIAFVPIPWRFCPGRSELRATSGTAAARLRAEQDWLELGRGAGLPVHAFRLGGAFIKIRDQIRLWHPGDSTVPIFMHPVYPKTRFPSRCWLASLTRCIQAARVHPQDAVASLL